MDRNVCKLLVSFSPRAEFHELLRMWRFVQYFLTMHGRVKVKTTAEKDAERKRAKAAKVERLKIVGSEVSLRFPIGQYEDSFMQLTSELLMENPDHVTIWNMRRKAVLHLLPLNPDDVSDIWRKESKLSEDCIMRQPKSYSAWYHRYWIAENNPNFDWKNELRLTEKALELDERNFHCWDYRRFLVKSGKLSLEAEIAFTDRLINKNFSNGSSWHQRSRLLPVVFPGPHGISIDVLSREMELVENAAFTDPDDQTAWLYLHWLLELAGCQNENCLEAVACWEASVILFFKHPVSKKSSFFQDLVEKLKLDVDSSEPFSSGQCRIWKTHSEAFNSIDSLHQTFEETVRAKRILSDGNGLLLLKPELGVPCEILEKILKSSEQLVELEPESKWANLMSGYLREVTSCDIKKFSNRWDSLPSLDKQRVGYYMDMRSKLLLKANQLSSSLKLCSFRISSFHMLPNFLFIEEVDLSNNDIVDTKPFAILLSVRKMNLNCNRISVCDGFRKLHNLRSLNLTENKVRDFSELEILSKLPVIEELIVKGNPVEMTEDMASAVAGGEQVALPFSFRLPPDFFEFVKVTKEPAWNRKSKIAANEELSEEPNQQSSGGEASATPLGEQKDRFIFQCLKCPANASLLRCDNSSRWAMTNHIERIHPSMYNEYKVKLNKLKGRPQSQHGTSSEGAAMKDYLNTGRIINPNPVSQQKKFSDATLNYIIGAVVPLSSQQTQAMLNLVQGLNPMAATKMPNRECLIDMLMEKFSNEKKNLQQELASVQHISMTADLWTTFGRTYICITAHWFDQNLLRHAAVLAVQPVHRRYTIDVIAKVFHEVLTEYSIQTKVTKCVVDNGSHFIRNFKICEPAKSDDCDTFSGHDGNLSQSVTSSHAGLGTSSTNPWRPTPAQRGDFMEYENGKWCGGDFSKAEPKEETINNLDGLDVEVFQAEKMDELPDSSMSDCDEAEGVQLFQVHKLETIMNAPAFESIDDETSQLLMTLPEYIRCASYTLNLVACDVDDFIMNHPVLGLIAHQEFSAVMDPLAISLTELQGEFHGGEINNAIGLGSLLPTLKMMEFAISEIQMKSGGLMLCDAVAVKLLTSLRHNFNKFYENEECIAAALCHPHFKDDWMNPFQRGAKQEKSKMILEQFIKKCLSPHLEPSAPNGPRQNEDTTGIAPCRSRLWSKRFRDQAPVQQTDSDPWSRLVEAEICGFLSDGDRSTDHLNNYPTIKKLFISLNTALPASAGVEKIFCLEPQWLTPHCIIDCDEHFEACVLLRANEKFRSKFDVQKSLNAGKN
ncbi:unnamed protein product [Notodromas monacha]|uniref:Geranylgeranyl transferase type-2 subunit alpha n=1 Tax=Notodromas monacha TaxID=399045 RepID=A0A7R9BMR5_9CRUS|nr:unnamed protein product [Notodromas monacha]CAG0918047.1 unnamed protein product [Notodromas monacha]